MKREAKDDCSISACCLYNAQRWRWMRKEDSYAKRTLGGRMTSSPTCCSVPNQSQFPRSCNLIGWHTPWLIVEKFPCSDRGIGAAAPPHSFHILMRKYVKRVQSVGKIFLSFFLLKQQLFNLCAKCSNGQLCCKIIEGHMQKKEKDGTESQIYHLNVI